MRARRIGRTYTVSLATNLDLLAKEMRIPLKVIREWRKDWLSYPVTEEDFRVLDIISTHVWGRADVMKVMMSPLRGSKKAKLVRQSGYSRPVAYMRELVLRYQLLGYGTRGAQQLKDEVRTRYFGGYLLVDNRSIRTAREWAKRLVAKTPRDSDEFALLCASVGLYVDDAGRVRRLKSAKKAKGSVTEGADGQKIFWD